MSGQWKEAARRGECGLTVLTSQRARDEGWLLPEGYGLFGLIEPDGEFELSIAFVDASRVASWARKMAPHTLRLRSAIGEDVAALRDALAAFGLQEERLH